MDEVPAFIAGPPITQPGRFFGRSREIRRIFNLLGRLPLQNGAVFGPRRCGKTSLLHYLRTVTQANPEALRPEQRRSWLPQPERYQWAFIDFQDARMGRRESLLARILQQLRLPAPATCNLEQFLEIVCEQLNTPAVILFDEIGVALDRYPELDNAFWESLRSLATNQVGGRLGFVLASHAPPEELAQQGGFGSPFFNIFGYSTPLGPLDEEAARSLLAASPRPLPAKDVDWILEQSQCWPFPLQILARECLFALRENESRALWRAEGLRLIGGSDQAALPNAPAVELPEPLSQRELEVLQLMAQGLANREIAHRLTIAVSTVKSHVNSIYGKLQVHNRTEAAVRGRMLGLLDD